MPHLIGESYTTMQKADVIAAIIAALTDQRDHAAAAADSVRPGSLVGLEDDCGNLRWLFIGRGAAGLKVTVELTEIFVVTPESPAGQGLTGLNVGEVVCLGQTEYALHSLI